MDLDSDVNRLASGILGNPLLYPVSVGYCTGPKRGVFCISIIAIILRSALVFFSVTFNKLPLQQAAS